jgi:uncharacterized protein (TIRG00374 family)
VSEIRPATPASPPSKPNRGWKFLRILFFLGGIGLLAYLIQNVGLATLMDHARRLGWTFLLLLFLYGILNFLRALSWKLCLGDDSAKLPLGTAINLWLAGEAVAHFAFGWSGEAFRAATIRSRVPFRKALSSLLVARMTYFYASMMIMLAGVLAAFVELPGRAGMQTGLTIAAVLLALLLLLPFGGARLISKEARPLHERLARTHPKSFLGRLHRFYHTVTDDLQTVFVQNRRTFYRLLAINLPAAFIGVLEVYLILQILTPGISLSEAIVIEGATKVLGVFSLIVPGNVGVREGGVVLILSQFELAASIGVALALVRRARAVAWVLIGCIPLFTKGLHELARKEPPPADTAGEEAENSRSVP